MADEEKAFSLGLKLLSYRDHSEAELVRKLRQRKFAADVIAATLSRLRELGFLNDERFARQWTDAAMRNGRAFGLRLRYDLARRGVAAEVIEAALSEMSAVHDEEEAVRCLLSRKFPDFNPSLAEAAEKRRVLQFLQRRGLSAAAIIHVFNSLDQIHIEDANDR